MRLNPFALTMVAAAAAGLAHPPPGRADGPAVDNSAGAATRVPGIAQLHGSLTNGPADVRICWGTADAGTNGPWANTLLLTNTANMFGPAATLGPPDYILNNGSHGSATIVE